MLSVALHFQDAPDNFRSKIVPKSMKGKRPGYTYRCPYCPTVFSNRFNVEPHILLEHPDLVALEKDKIADSIRRYESLSKKHERIIDRKRVEMHLDKFKDILNKSEHNFASLMSSVEHVLNEAMVFIGNEADYLPRRYTQTVNAFKQLKSSDVYEMNPVYTPVWL